MFSLHKNCREKKCIIKVHNHSFFKTQLSVFNTERVGGVAWLLTATCVDITSTRVELYLNQ